MSRSAPHPPHLLLAGGGSGGHVFPALAVGDELARRGWSVTFAGRRGSIEARLAEGAGLPLLEVEAQPIVGQGALRRMVALGRLGVASVAAARRIRSRRVDAVLGTGGYVSAPTVIGSRLAGRPVLLLEPNASAGAANRFLSRFAHEAAIAYPDTAGQLRCPSRRTGVPVRSAFHRVPAELPSGPGLRVMVLGGSQGARQLNQLVPAALARIARTVSGLEVLHQAGAAHREETLAAYRGHDLDRSAVEVVPFLDDVAGAMADCHLVVSRAGAVTLAEICAAGRPSLLVPLTLAGGHQRRNAEALVAAGAAAVTPEGELGAEHLSALMGPLLADRSRLQAMAHAARGLARPGSAAEIADRLAALGGAV